LQNLSIQPIALQKPQGQNPSPSSPVLATAAYMPSQHQPAIFHNASPVSAGYFQAPHVNPGNIGYYQPSNMATSITAASFSVEEGYLVPNQAAPIHSTGVNPPEYQFVSPSNDYKE
jgi:hypothetical protein